MELPSSERILHPISTQELERRWGAVRKAMARAGIDCLVVQNNNQHLGGYVRWFTDVPAANAYPRTIVLPVDDEMTMISSGGTPNPLGPPAWAARGVKERINLPYFSTMHYTNTMDAEAVVAAIKKRNAKRVGLVNKGCIPAAFYEYLMQKLPPVEIVDATDLVDEIKAVKSAEEIALIKRAVAMHDAAFAAVPAIVRPARKEWEITSDLQHLLVDMGSEEQLILVGSAPPDSPSGQKVRFFQNRTLQPGDQVSIMIEASGPGGFYGEMARSICLGDPSPALLRAWEAATEAQRFTAGLLRPGARPADVIRAHNQFMEGKGYPAEGRLYAHGQGYDLVERPAIREDEPMALRANMNVSVHPVAISRQAFAFCSDNYLIGETGAVRLNQTPLEIMVV